MARRAHRTGTVQPPEPVHDAGPLCTARTQARIPAHRSGLVCEDREMCANRVGSARPLGAHVCEPGRRRRSPRRSHTGPGLGSHVRACVRGRAGVRTGAHPLIPGVRTQVLVPAHTFGPVCADSEVCASRGRGAPAHPALAHSLRSRRTRPGLCPAAPVCEPGCAFAHARHSHTGSGLGTQLRACVRGPGRVCGLGPEASALPAFALTIRSRHAVPGRWAWTGTRVRAVVEGRRLGRAVSRPGGGAGRWRGRPGGRRRRGRPPPSRSPARTSGRG